VLETFSRFPVSWRRSRVPQRPYVEVASTGARCQKPADPPVVCEPCGRRGRYNVERLIPEHGAEAKLTDLLEAAGTIVTVYGTRCALVE
jgi:hypothetical protein